VLWPYGQRAIPVAIGLDHDTYAIYVTLADDLATDAWPTETSARGRRLDSTYLVPIVFGQNHGHRLVDD